jgi:hypothetical protein
MPEKEISILVSLDGRQVRMEARNVQEVLI